MKSEVIDVRVLFAREIFNCQIEVRIEPPRPGDPSRRIADAAKARAVLGWNPKYTKLEAIIRTAWEWHQAHLEGYEK